MSARDELNQVYASTAQCVQRAPSSVEALNLKGLICESRGSLSTAIISFQLADHIMKQGSGKMDSSAGKRRSIILLNLARVLCRVSQPLNNFIALEDFRVLGSTSVTSEPTCLWMSLAWVHL